jgi:hypothetical protein
MMGECRKILCHGADGFTFPQREVVLLIFIALKSPSPPPGLNPLTLGTTASALNITPPRTTPLALRRISLKIYVKHNVLISMLILIFIFPM